MNTGNEDKYWFVFISGSLLLEKTDETYSVPVSDTPPTKVHEWTYIQHLPSIDGKECMAYTINTPSESLINGKYVTVGLRASFKLIPIIFYNMAGKASELLYWDQSTKYCGVCGAPTKRMTNISKKCTHCGKEIWPQVAPAVIVRIRQKDSSGKERILLVHARNFKSNFYGLVAGFVETGESLEETIQREVKEETSLTIKNIKYFGSQSWPYPSGIMIAFTADYDSGELLLQEEELSYGGWFEPDNMPQIPDKASIARRLIDDWIDNLKS